MCSVFICSKYGDAAKSRTTLTALGTAAVVRLDGIVIGAEKIARWLFALDR